MKTLSLKEAAEFLRLSADALRDMAVAGKVPGAQLGPNGGRIWIFTDESLEEYLRQEINRQTAAKRVATAHGAGRQNTRPSQEIATKANQYAMTEFPYKLRDAATPFWFDKTKSPSLVETLAVFKPIIAGINSLRDEVITVHGYPAFIDHTGQLSRIDHALRGWIDCWKRMDPSMDTSPLSRLAKKLEYGMPLFEEDIEECAANLNKQISRFMVLPTEAILHHAMTEQISIQLEQMGIKEAA